MVAEYCGAEWVVSCAWDGVSGILLMEGAGISSSQCRITITSSIEKKSAK